MRYDRVWARISTGVSRFVPGIHVGKPEVVSIGLDVKCCDHVHSAGFAITSAVQPTAI